MPLKFRKPPAIAVSPETQEMIDTYGQFIAIADALGMPRQWHTCEMCHAMGFAMPPHLFGPCPIIEGLSEAHNLNLDATRNSTIRTVTNMEEFLNMLRQQMGDNE